MSTRGSPLEPVCRQLRAIAGEDKRDDEPEGGGVEGIPEDFVGRGDVGAENDEGGSGTDVEELGEENALGVGIGPGDQHTHRGHGCGEHEEKWNPIVTVGRRSAKKVDHGQMPEAPEQAKGDGGGERASILDQFREGKAHPADFFEDACGDAEEDTEPEVIGCIRGGNQGAQSREDEENEDRSKREDGIPTRRKAPAGEPCKQIVEAWPAVEGDSQSQGGEGRPKKHGGEHENAGELRRGFVVKEARSSHGESAGPGDKEGEEKVGRRRVSIDEGCRGWRHRHGGIISQGSWRSARLGLFRCIKAKRSTVMKEDGSRAAVSPRG